MFKCFFLFLLFIVFHSCFHKYIYIIRIQGKGGGVPYIYIYILKKTLLIESNNAKVSRQTQFYTEMKINQCLYIKKECEKK
ncbi:hypothetical protein BDA99DRAFT_13662 [Phascolomyces articulosus]|uniref:Lipoprotein n=1 Tax=Phascolomyces articulosus TaxID=60185 RepID=A0AAD5KCZ8_9FUNG|nr:hypothetical protein BDA99DRAFT_13662 [Phascolomyces articulosus]